MGSKLTSKSLCAGKLSEAQGQAIQISFVEEWMEWTLN